jgi:hypothetical protein
VRAHRVRQTRYLTATIQRTPTGGRRQGIIFDRIVFLLLNLALAFYNVGTIWAHEIDIFRSWKLLEHGSFHEIQRVHWRKLVYWIFIPVGLALIGGIALVWYHPVHSPAWAIWGALLCQVLALALTAIFWGRWQAKLSLDSSGSRSPYLAKS